MLLLDEVAQFGRSHVDAYPTQKEKTVNVCAHSFHAGAQNNVRVILNRQIQDLFRLASSASSFKRECAPAADGCGQRQRKGCFAGARHAADDGQHTARDVRFNQIPCGAGFKTAGGQKQRGLFGGLLLFNLCRWGFCRLRMIAGRLPGGNFVIP